MRIRKYRTSDNDALYRLFRQQTESLPFHHNVRRDQFNAELFTTRFIRNPADHCKATRIGLVATRNKQPVAFVSGGLVLNGDEVVDSNTGYIQAIIADRSTVDVLKEMLQRVIDHIRASNPDKIVAFDACMCPTFFADSAGNLPTEWAWMGQCLIDVGFEVRGRSLRLATTLEKPRREVTTPDELMLYHLKHEMYGFNPKYDFGCLLLKPPYQYGDGVVWCGDFYSGAFVKGTAFRSLYMNYFTIIDEAFQGRGLGRLTLQHCLYEAQKNGSQFASLLTDFDNLIAQNLYASEGFTVVDAMHSFELKNK